MSIFIADLAFDAQPTEIDAAKLSILVASAMSGVFGCLWLRNSIAIPATEKRRSVQ